MHNKRLALKSEIIKRLTVEQLAHAKGGVITWTEPYSFCGMCIPVTYMTCDGCARRDEQ